MGDQVHSSELLIDVQGPVLRVTFSRPAQHNAMTWSMYDGLIEACAVADSDPSIRVMVLRGAGDRAFVAGTDISQFAAFRDGQDGVAYERRIADVVNRLEGLSIPTVAQVQGFCMGGGLVIAAVCDLRVATPDSQFGVPIARTLGNCLSMNSCSLLVHHLGPARTLDLLLRARLLTGKEAYEAGFVSQLAEAEELHDAVDEVVATLLTHAPLTLWASKRAVSRLRQADLPNGDDLVEQVFGSRDFKAGVAAFGTKSRVDWTGQ